MQLVSFRKDDLTSFGAVIEGRVVDLGRHMPEYDSLKALLAANALVKALDTVAEASPDYRLDKVDLRVPVTDMESLFCVFDDAHEAPVSVDPKFVRGPNRALRIPGDDDRPVAAGVAVIIGTSEQGYLPLGYCLVSYLSPAALAAGPWLTTPDELPEPVELQLYAAVGDKSADLHLPDPTDMALMVAEDKSLNTGDMVAILHFLPGVSAGADESIEITAPDLGALTSPIECQTD